MDQNAAPSTGPHTCASCGAAVSEAMREQHEEWHRRVDDATWGACPA